MAGARRRLNYTGRQRIRREHIEVRMLENASGTPLRAELDLDLSGYGLPDSAFVIFEAYHRSSLMRFDLGTVGTLNIPPVLVLSEVDHIGSVNFRLKVVDVDVVNGRALATAERIKARSEEDDDPDGRRSLMTVSFKELGHEIWRVDLASDSRPELLINREIPGIKHQLQESAVIQAFLLPAALRVVLENLFPDQGYVDDDDDDIWQKEWKEFCNDELGMVFEGAASLEDRDDWVNECIRRFCRKSGFLGNLKKQLLEA